MSEITSPDIRNEQGGATVVSGQASTVILGPLRLDRYGAKTFSVYNPGASLTLSGVIVQVNPDPNGVEPRSPTDPNNTVQVGPNPALWHMYDETSFCSVGPGQTKSLAVYPYVKFPWWRVIGTVNNAGMPGVAASGYCWASAG